MYGAAIFTLRPDLDPPGYAETVLDMIEQNRELLKALNTEKLILFLAIGLIVVVAALNIVSTLILMVTDKVKEIGTLSSMGARSNGIAAGRGRTKPSRRHASARMSRSSPPRATTRKPTSRPRRSRFSPRSKRATKSGFGRTTFAFPSNG